MCRESREIGDWHGLAVYDSAQFPHFLMRLFQEFIEQAEFIH